MKTTIRTTLASPSVNRTCAFVLLASLALVSPAPARNFSFGGGRTSSGPSMQMNRGGISSQVIRSSNFSSGLGGSNFSTGGSFSGRSFRRIEISNMNSPASQFSGGIQRIQTQKSFKPSGMTLPATTRFDISRRPKFDRVKNLGGQSLAKNLNSMVDPNRRIGSLSKPGKGPSLARLSDGGFAKRIGIDNQVKLGQVKLGGQGDIARRLDLAGKLAAGGGWQKRKTGFVSKEFTKKCFGDWYCGPSGYPKKCWYPKYCGWVNWCWWDTCAPHCDPRPFPCRPVVCNPCGTWTCWNYPVWQPLPVVVCGTWIDVAPVAIPSGVDLQLLAVRFVDPGHGEKALGPRYRIWLRNNSDQTIARAFTVHAMAANGSQPATGMPEAGVRVESIEAGKTISVDLRLPATAMLAGRDAAGNQVPFSSLHVLIDSGRAIAEAIEDNNGLVIDREKVLPVDPVIFATNEKTAPAGGTINLAGEGFGPEPGQVRMTIGGLDVHAEIEGWYDLGARVKTPALPLAEATDVKLVVVRGDGAASNELSLELAPAEVATLAPPSPTQ